MAEGKDCGAGVWRRSPRVKVSWHPPRLALHHRYSPTRCLVPPSLAPSISFPQCHPPLSSHATLRQGTPPWRSRLRVSVNLNSRRGGIRSVASWRCDGEAGGGRQPSDCPRHASLSRRFGRQPRQQPGPGAAREARRPLLHTYYAATH